MWTKPIVDLLFPRTRDLSATLVPGRSPCGALHDDHRARLGRSALLLREPTQPSSRDAASPGLGSARPRSPRHRGPWRAAQLQQRRVTSPRRGPSELNRDERRVICRGPALSTARHLRFLLDVETHRASTREAGDSTFGRATWRGSASCITECRPLEGQGDRAGALDSGIDPTLRANRSQASPTRPLARAITPPVGVRGSRYARRRSTSATTGGSLTFGGFAALGSAGQAIYVLPEDRTVVVMTGGLSTKTLSSAGPDAAVHSPRAEIAPASWSDRPGARDATRKAWRLPQAVGVSHPRAAHDIRSDLRNEVRVQEDAAGIHSMYLSFDRDDDPRLCISLGGRTYRSPVALGDGYYENRIDARNALALMVRDERSFDLEWCWLSSGERLPASLSALQRRVSSRSPGRSTVMSLT